MDAIANMKKKVIADFDVYIKNLNLGCPNDYTKILHEISFISTYMVLDKIDPIYEFLINS